MAQDTSSSPTPPSELDFQIAAARLQDGTRDCRIGDSPTHARPDDKVWVQIFVPKDPALKPGSKVTWAAAELIEKVIPGFGSRNDAFINAGENRGFIFSKTEIERLRKELAKKYSKTEPAAGADTHPAPISKPLANDDCAIYITPRLVRCGSKSSDLVGVTWDRATGNIYFLRKNTPPSWADTLTDELVFEGFRYDGLTNHDGKAVEIIRPCGEKVDDKKFAAVLKLFVKHHVLPQNIATALTEEIEKTQDQKCLRG